MATERRLVAYDPIAFESFTRDATRYCEPYDRYDVGYMEAVEHTENWLEQNTVDAVEVVRCCDCLHCIPWQQYADAEVILYCKKKRPAVVDPTDFCSHGERRTE